MVLYICLFENIIFAFMPEARTPTQLCRCPWPEDDFGIKLKASEKLKI